MYSVMISKVFEMFSQKLFLAANNYFSVMISGVLEMFSVMISKVFDQYKLFLANVLIYFLITLKCSD